MTISPWPLASVRPESVYVSGIVKCAVGRDEKHDEGTWNRIPPQARLNKGMAEDMGHDAIREEDELALLSSLRTRIMLGTGLLLVLVLGAFMYVDIRARKADMLAQEEGHASGVSHTLMESVEYPMLAGEMDQVQAILHKATELADVRVVYISDGNGIIVYSGLPGGTGRGSASRMVKESLRTHALTKGIEAYGGEKILGHAMPIRNDQPCFKCHGREKKMLGVLFVGTAWGPIEKNIRARLNQRIVYSILGLALVVGLMAILLSHLVITPIGSLTRATMVMAKGDLSRRVPVERDDEIGHLGSAFNQMAENLEKSRDQLLETQASLEKSVIQLETRTKELEDFTYIVSHDLKEPLRGITAFAQFVLEDYSDKLDATGEGYLATIMKSAERLKKLIDDLLVLSRVTRTEVSCQVVKASDVIGEAIERVKYGIDEKGVQVMVAEDLPSIYCDSSKLVQVFANLLSNAAKFTGKDNPKIEIGCQDMGDHDRFFVRDNGMGIEKDYHQRIFGMFQRLHRREDYEGTGAGLHIAQKIIERHGGKIWVESELGAGSTFYFTLPKRSYS